MTFNSPAPWMVRLEELEAENRALKLEIARLEGQLSRAAIAERLYRADL